MNQVRKADPNNKTVAENRKARFSYEVLDTIEAGLVLTGTEVKSLRQGQANIQDAYASLEGGEIWLINSYLPEYLQANRFNHEPRRRRKLLLNKREMAQLGQSVEREGMTMVPLKIYFNDQGRAKLLLAVGARQEAARQARDRKAARLGAREGPAAEGARLTPAGLGGERIAASSNRCSALSVAVSAIPAKDRLPELPLAFRCSATGLKTLTNIASVSTPVLVL